jgi:ADP-heptose:LPS heptosyltransferase
MKKKLLIIGYRAFGDWLYASSALPRMFEEYDVFLETNGKGIYIFHDDERLKGMSVVGGMRHWEADEIEKKAKERWAEVEAFVKPDRTINLWKAIEYECMADRSDPSFWKKKETRREMFGQLTYHHNNMARFGLNGDDIKPNMGLYFSEENHEWGKRWRERHSDQKIIMLMLAGSCYHKMNLHTPGLINDILDRYPNAVIYLVGDKPLENITTYDPRLRNICGQTAIMQAILMTKYVDLVVGPETGILVAAGQWGTPKIMFCTSTTPHQACWGQDNDMSIQSDSVCSPCHRAIYVSEDCESLVKEGADIWAECTMKFDTDEILRRVDYALR